MEYTHDTVFVVFSTHKGTTPSSLSLEIGGQTLDSPVDAASLVEESLLVGVHTPIRVGWPRSGEREEHASVSYLFDVELRELG